MSEVIDLGPRSEKERLIFAIEEMRVSVQWAIQEAMVDKGINRAELARRLGISAARVTQMLSEDANPRLETIAKVAFCLDVDLTLARTEAARPSSSTVPAARSACWENRQIPELENEVGERFKNSKKDEVHLIEQIKSCIVKASGDKRSVHSNSNGCTIKFVRTA